MPEKTPKADSNDPDLKEIRDEFAYAQTEKAEIRKAGAEDMRAIDGDGWDPEERRLREDAGRPCIWLDELGQYVNQLINDVRQNKRSIKAAPQGRGASDETADLRQNLIRQIEYRSNAQQAYAVMFENAAQRSYGYLRIKPEYVSHRSNDQELRIVSIPNPDMVVEDPAAQRTDGGDWKFLYFGEEWTHAAFTAKWKDAKPLDFAFATRTPGLTNWVKTSRVLLAERWRIKTVKKTLYMVTPPPLGAVDPATGQPLPPPAPFFAFKDDPQFTQRPKGSTVTEAREVDYPTVKKQITNGQEILEETDFPGTSIPFVACYGKVLYLDSGGVQKKRIHSLIRLSRAAAMKHAYLDSCEVEVIGAVPRASWVGYKGQFSAPEEWQKSNHEPVVYLEAELTVEGAAPGTVLPLPQRQTWDPPIQNLELAKESARRAIQAAIGSSPLPTQAQRRNEKSGIALQHMDDSAAKGSFHFVDHFDDALMRTGTILDELIPHYYDTARDVTVRRPDDQAAVVRINDPAHKESVSATDGDHDITISVGPRQASEREAASEFADTIIGSQLIAMMPPPLALKVVALAIRLKAVGPIGDEIADILSPKEADGAQGPTPQQVQQMQGQIQELTAKLQQAAMALETDQAKEQGKVEIEKIKAAMNVELQKMKDATAIRVAEINAETKGVVSGHEAAHEAQALGVELSHDADQAERDRQHEAGLTAMRAEHQAQAAAQGHAQNLEAGNVGHEQQLQAGEIEAQRAAAQAAADGAVS